jgi:cysteine desulfuration protein SufE
VVDELDQILEIPEDERNQFLMDMGRKIPDMPEESKIEKNRVHGCMSVVYFYGSILDNSLRFFATSDSYYVRGLIWILDVSLNGRPIDVVRLRLKSLDSRFESLRIVSMRRRMGLNGIIQRIERLVNSDKT